MQRRTGLILGALALAGVMAMATTAQACPFCTATAQTFSQEIASMDVAVIAKLVKVPVQSNEPGDEIQKATFQIAEVLKGDGLVKQGEKFETLYFGDGKPGRSFLVTGIDPPKIMWSTPLPLSERAIGYLRDVLKQPAQGIERLVFFQKYLEDEDEMLARDAYDEFAGAPYDQVKALKPHMNHDQIVAWIKNPEIPASRRRLYLVMLGVCGNKSDVAMLEEFMRSSDRKAKAGLDSLIACYLTLRGNEGLELVEELFLANDKSDYADTYAAIMALRFHATDGGVLDKERLLKSFHYMLDRPELADLVIPDLAKFEDWKVMDRLFELFKTANEKNSWVRVPVINYLRACPLPKAKELLKECEKIDPAAVKRANTFFPSSPATPQPPADKATQNAPRPRLDDAPPPIDEIPAPQAASGATLAAAVTAPSTPPDEGSRIVTAINQGVGQAEAARRVPGPAPNLWAILGVPWAVGIALIAVQWSVLCGGRR